jgi:hypothetical protein
MPEPGCLPSAGFWLLLLRFGVCSQPISCRVFLPAVLISTIDRDVINSGFNSSPLHPVSGNLTQSGYALGGSARFRRGGGVAGRRG